MTEGIHYAKRLESAVLGACLLEKTAFGRIYGTVDEQSFYSDDNKKVFKYLLLMFDKSAPIDCITVWQEMTAKGETLHAGNVAWYLSVLTNDVVSTAHLEYHAVILKEMWRKREIEFLTKGGVDPDEDTRDQIAKINTRINEIRGSDYRKEWHSMDELMIGLIQHQARIKDGTVKPVTTGFKMIDRLNGGFWPGQMIVVGARPSMGKSALIGKIAIDIAKQQKSVGIVSLEMDNNQIAARLAAVETDIDFQTLYRNLFTDENQRDKFFDKVANGTIQLPIYVSDKTKVDVNEIKAAQREIITVNRRSQRSAGG
jgi:replicative DNA helicase